MARSTSKRSEMELLGSEEVSELMGVKESTVWRWCREGTLPCLKVGKHWRIRREVLEDFLRRSERSTTLVEQLDSFLQVPDNVLAIAEDLDTLHRVDAAFFRVGQTRGGLLVKFYRGENEPVDKLMADFERNGLDAGRLEREGSLLMRPEEYPLDGREDVLGRLVAEEAEKGRTVWASFDWALEVDLETDLAQQRRLSELVDTRQLVVKTAALDAAIEEWSATALRRALASHAGTILASGSGLSLSRANPMPAS